MQSIFFDIPAGAIKRNPQLQHCLQTEQVQAGTLRRRGYDRLLLRAEDHAEMLALLEQMTFEASTDWILEEESQYYRPLLEPEPYKSFQRRAKQRMQQMEPRLRQLIRQDLEQLTLSAHCFNVWGYFRFSARKLKRLLQRLLQEEYHRLEHELEQEEFVDLLRFFISVQSPVLDNAYLTIYGSRFTLVDEWGNDLRQIYLESLMEEEITGVSDNDLILSILLTLLPRRIYLEIKEEPRNAEFLTLLQQVFGDQMIWQQAERQ